jgi:N-acetylglucosaminyl-diphospho-decaprenol L-rhamnosyltransferase
MTSSERVALTVVVITRNRVRSLERTLEQLLDDPDRPEVVVVDNASTDESAEVVRRRFPDVRLVCLDQNLGAAGRNVGVDVASHDLVAFSDDDSWWRHGALRTAAARFEAHPRLGLLAARVLVGPEERLDPTCAAMATSPLEEEHDLPGPPVLGFLACGSIVRRQAFALAGGFFVGSGIGGEESLLAIDLAAGGWGVAYDETVVAHHHPSAIREPSARSCIEVRNELWTAWLRLPVRDAAATTVRVLARASTRRSTRAGVIMAFRGLQWALRARRPISGPLARRWRRVRLASS